MIKIIFIVPYFGLLPPYFKIWLKTVEKNTTIDFLLISDADITETMPKNVKLLSWTFEYLKEYMQSKFDFPIALEKPYKLCDFKPTYGYIFQDYIYEYDFWGHCDIDCVFGDLRKCLNPELKQYDAIGSYGHLSLYRNCEVINTCFKKEGAVYGSREVFSNKENYAFDETSGIKRILKIQKMNCKYDIDLMADISTIHKSFQINHGIKNYREQIFMWQNGKVLQCYMKNSKLYYKEFMYLHFQKKCPISRGDIEDGFYIFYDRMVPRNDDELDLIMMKHQRIYRSMLFRIVEKVIWILRWFLQLATLDKKQRDINNKKRRYR